MIPKNTVIGFLVVSAVIFACLLFVINTVQPTPAHAATASRAGYFVVATATITAGEDLLWLVNVDTQRLVVLGADNRGNINTLASTNLAAVFQSPTPTTTTVPPAAP